MSDILYHYAPARWTLIPLHHPSATRERHGQVVHLGKVPIDLKWTTRDYDSWETAERCFRDGLNIGVRLSAAQLVIDVDDRNGGFESFERLCIDANIDPLKFPKVVTGSGAGFHLYCGKPPDMLIVDSIDGYPGVEFKSKGRQVVAPPSTHPLTGNKYFWDDQHPHLSKIVSCPDALLNLIRRPQPMSAFGGGQATQEQIERVLDRLNPTEFGSNEKWFPVMCACHHASAGEARQAFVNWSICDPQFKDHAQIIGNRWDSLHREKHNGYTYRTLNKLLRDRGEIDASIPGDASGDFTGEENFEGFHEDAIPSLESMNEMYCAVMDGGKFFVMTKRFDEVTKTWSWTRITDRDFKAYHQHQSIECTKRGKSTTVKLGTAWLEWGRRKTVKQVVFDPARDHPDCLNLWTGFTVDPSPKGSWNHLRDLIYEVLADNDPSVFEYVLNWSRFMFQKPEVRAEVAIAFRGQQGVGKGTFANVLARLFGRHALAIASAELLTGRFNAHLQDRVLLFADEAIRPTDHYATSRLKALITEPYLAYEGKGRDVMAGKNYLHIIMASNDQWIIPAGLEERRFMVSDASARWKGRPDKFAALHDELEKDGNSGYRRLLFDLLREPLPTPDWHPARHIPSTEAMSEQKVRSFPPLHRYLHGIITEGQLPQTIPPINQADWLKEPIQIFASDLRSAFASWCRDGRINPLGYSRGDLHFMLRDLAVVIPGAETKQRATVPESRFLEVTPSPSDGRAQALTLPSLPECRAALNRLLS